MESSGGTLKRLLVVEDEPAIREICQRVLNKEGFRVETAKNGKEAQDMIEDKPYDLLLIDIRMPEMSGIELYRWLQEAYPLLSSRVLFTTGSVIGEDTKSFLEESHRPCLFKPFTPDELKKAIKEMLVKRGKWLTKQKTY